jgi:SAM-dependent methyltransferase
MRWEKPNCAFCGSSKNRFFMESSVPRWYERKPIRLVTCNRCRLVYASPRPIEEDLYEGYLYGDQSAEKVYNRKLNRPNVRQGHLNTVKRIEGLLKKEKNLQKGKKKKLFDMGCGAGTILLAAQELGYEAHGNDINKYSCDRLKEQGIFVQNAFSKDLKLPPEEYDIVTCLDYLEHTYFPLNDLKLVYSILKEDGIFYMKTLYLGCPGHRQKGEAWQLFGAAHFYYFWPDVLMSMMIHAGFKIFRVWWWENVITIASKKGIPMEVFS